jgi:hypothetical protein
MTLVTSSSRLAACGLAVFALAGCGSSSPGADATAPSAPVSAPAPSTSPPISMSPSASSSASPTAPTRGVVNLPITETVRAQLLAAGANEKGLVAADFVGLQKGFTYYAFDASTNTYWAGASLQPSPKSQAAMVSVQDDGSYTLFHKAVDGSWVAGDTGMIGTAPADTPCGIATPPAAVLQAWSWPPHTCHAPGT